MLFLGVFAVSCRGHLCGYLTGSASSWFHPFVRFSPQNPKHLAMKKSRISIISSYRQIHYPPASLANTSSQVSLPLELFSHLSGPTEVPFPHVSFSGAQGGKRETRAPRDTLIAQRRKRRLAIALQGTGQHGALPRYSTAPSLSSQPFGGTT